jgi:hypothetical protein
LGRIDFQKFAFFPLFSAFFPFFHKNDGDLTLFGQKGIGVNGGFVGFWLLNEDFLFFW